MKKIHINYAALGSNYANNDPNGGYFNAQKINSKTAISVAGFDDSVNYSFNSLDDDFRRRHQKHFCYTRGAGYWVWKPYIIAKQLQKMNNNDILMYTDSGCHFINSMQPVFAILEQTAQKVLVFRLAQIEKDWTKRDCFVHFDCDNSDFADTKQIMSTFFLCKKNDFSQFIVQQWCENISNFHLVADDFISPSVAVNYDSFKEHRHDQSLLSLISKKNKVEFMEDITEWGNPELRKIPQIISHTRRRD